MASLKNNPDQESGNLDCHPELVESSYWAYRNCIGEFKSLGLDYALDALGFFVRYLDYGVWCSFERYSTLQMEDFEQAVGEAYSKAKELFPESCDVYFWHAFYDERELGGWMDRPKLLEWALADKQARDVYAILYLNMDNKLVISEDLKLFMDGKLEEIESIAKVHPTARYMDLLSYTSKRHPTWYRK